ncbi:MAG: amidohydrolase family protein [Opitutaceae bacterium]|nr:amidohydrolase family protein [Opitutaceae bacterium]
MSFLHRNRCRILACLLLILALLLAPFLFAAPPPREPPPAAPLVDLHCHTAGLGAGGSGCFVSPRMERSFKLHFYLRSFGVTKAELRREGDALVLRRLAERLAGSRHVSHAVVLALDGAVDAHGELDRARTEVYVPNEFLAAEIPRHPNLRWGASVNPHRHDALSRLEAARAQGAVLVKWLPSIQHIDPADARLIPYYRKLVELGLPLLTHTGNEHAFTQAHDEWCDPERLRLPLSLGVVVIAAHAGTSGSFAGERSFDRLARLMTEYPNLYADVSSLTQLNKRRHLGELIARPEFRGRLLYGTDYPLIEIRSLVSPWYFASRLSLREIRACAGIANPWDRDVALKHALGLPADAWTRGEAVLGPIGRPPS